MELLPRVPDWAFIAAGVAVVLWPKVSELLRGIKGGGAKNVSMKDALDAIAKHVAANCEAEGRTRGFEAIDTLRTHLTK